MDPGEEIDTGCEEFAADKEFVFPNRLIVLMAVRDEMMERANMVVTLSLNFRWRFQETQRNTNKIV